MSDDDLMDVLARAAAAVRSALDRLGDWGPAGIRPGQYHSDLVADAAALEVIDEAGMGALSEESGLHHPERELVVVVDPVDGSTNAARGIPWFATSLCVLDQSGARAALVVNQASGTTFEARRGAGASCDGRPIHPSATTGVAHAMLGLSGYPPRHLGWRQYRALGAAALDICAVASGVLDAYVDCTGDAHGPWDYLGAMLVCQEAGASVVDREGRDLVVREHGDRRTVVAAATPELLEAVLGALSP